MLHLRPSENLCNLGSRGRIITYVYCHFTPSQKNPIYLSFVRIFVFQCPSTFPRSSNKTWEQMRERKMGRLTVLSAKNAKAGRHGDGRGLYLLVKATGARSWVLRV